MSKADLLQATYMLDRGVRECHRRDVRIKELLATIESLKNCANCKCGQLVDGQGSNACVLRPCGARYTFCCGNWEQQELIRICDEK